MKEQLLELAYNKEREFAAEIGAREFSCLIGLIDCGAIESFEDLAEYGVEA